MVPWTAFVTLDHIGVVRLRQLARHNTHVQTGAFQGSCHFILGHYAPDMFWQLTVPSVLYVSLNFPTVYSQRGVPIIMTGCLKSRQNGNPGMPIFTGCVYLHDTEHYISTVAHRVSLSCQRKATERSENRSHRGQRCPITHYHTYWK